MQIVDDTNENISNEYPNYSLEELTSIEELSVRSCNVCKLITTPLAPFLSDILFFYKKNNSFLKLKNCGEKSNEEIIRLCKKYITSTVNIIDSNENIDKLEQFKINIINSEQFNIDEVTKSQYLSVRAYNICIDNNLKNLKDILDFYVKNKSFIQFQNCGEKANSELVKLCIKHIDTWENTNGTDANYNKIKLEYFNIYKLKIFENLSVRAYNVCENNNLKNLKEILDFYYKNGSFKQLQNCGEKANSELIQLCLKYKNEISPPNFEEINYESNISIISFRLKINILDYIKDFKIYYDNKNILLFKFV